MSSKSQVLNLVKPYFLEMWICRWQRSQLTHAGKQKKKKKSINTVLSFPKVNSSICESISVHQHVLSQWSLKALGTSQPRTYTTKESLSAALAHLNRTAAELVGLISCRALNWTHFPWALTLPSGVQGTWTWLYAEPRWCAPCSGPWYGPTWSPGQCGHGPRCPAVYQRHHASRSGAWGAEQTRGQSAWLKKCPGWDFTCNKRRVWPISSSAGQHLVDADHVEGMQAHADVEAVFAAGLHHVLVSADAGSLQSCSGGRGAEAEWSQHSLTAENPKTVTSSCS